MESLTEMADAFSRFHMGQPFQGLVQHLVAQGVQLVKTAHNPFQLSDELKCISFLLVGYHMSLL